MDLLKVKNMTIEFHTEQGPIEVLREVSFSIGRGEILGMIGESGSGKSICARALMGLLPKDAQMTNGKILFAGNETAPKQLRGKQIAMILQDPMTCLNPAMRIGAQLTETILEHHRCTKQESKEQAEELLEQVGIRNPKACMKRYPHECSGGMRQRIVIAIALACQPQLIIADEPTTALDVTVQAQILDLLNRIAKESGTAILLISHDLGVVASLCERVQILYGGKIVETGTVEEIFYETRHPYTNGLLGSVEYATDGKKKTLRPIPGMPPDPAEMPEGCPFVTRCREAMQICKNHVPVKHEFSETQYCACWKYGRLEAERMFLGGKHHGG